MSSKLSEILANTNGRVTALENNDLDDAAGVARITKIYGNLKITATISASVHQYLVCSDTLPCSETLII